MEYKYLIEKKTVKGYFVLCNDYLLYRLDETLYLRPHILYYDMFCPEPPITQRRLCDEVVFG